MEASPAINSIRLFSFDGWALERAAILDLQNSRGLIADIAVLPFLKRQAAFVILAEVPADALQPFLDRLGEPHSSVGDVIRTRTARDLVAAALGVQDVPTGYFRALTRLGSKPLDEPRLYRRLFDIFTAEAESPKAHALRYCGPITSETIRIVDALDPVLVCPEIVKHTRSVAHARKANRIVQFLRSVCSTATDDVLAAGIRQASGHAGLESFAQEFIKKADCFPEPPLPSRDGFVPLTSAAEFVSLGRDMKNCLPSKIPQALLGLASYYRMDARIGGEDVPVVVELTPLSNGGWNLESLNMPKNQRLPREVMADLVKRLKRLGVAVVANPRLHPQAKDLVRFLGVYPVGEFQLLKEEDELDAASDEMDAMLDVVLEEMEQALRVA